ncbi:MAG: TetR/AcrR family transcriptional regulator [Flavobacteriaceae bacterium]
MKQKEYILKAGLELFSTQAYSNTGIRQITSKVGIPTGSFHYYFKNKEDFALAVLDYYFEEELKTNLLGNLLVDNETTAKDKIIQLFTKALNFHKANSSKNLLSSCILGNLGQEISGHNNAVAGKINGFFQKIHFAVQTLIDMGKKDGSIKLEIDSEQLANFIFDAYEGTLIRRKVEQSNTPATNFLNTLKTLL